MQNPGGGLEGILEDIEEGVFALDADGMFTYLNPAVEGMLGRAREELVGKSLREECPQEFSSAFYRAYQRALHEQADVELSEYSTRLATWLDLKFRPSGEGAVVRLRMMSPERSGTEEALAECERRLADSQRLAGVGSWEWDVASNTLVWSDEQYRLFGLDPQRFGATYEAFLQRVHPDDRGLVARSVEESLESPDPFEYEYRIMVPGGEVRRLHARAKTLQYERGAPARMAGTVQDVTDRVRLQSELERSLALHRNVVDLAPDAIITMDAEGLIRSFNRSAERVFGYAAPEVLGVPMTMLMPEQFREPHAEGLRRYLRTGESRVIGRTVEFAGLHKSGRQFPLELSIAEVPDGGGELFTGIVRDISERKALEAQLEHQAFNDPLTGLPNRELFMDRLSHALVRGAHESGGNEQDVALLLLDLDRFKLVNDSLGHEAGDTLLAEVGRRLRTSLLPEHTLARLGGDEFAIVLEEVSEVEDALRTAQWVLGSLGLPFRVDGSLQYVRASIGVASSGPDGESPTELLRNADIAMYRAKHAGGARYELYAPTMRIESTRHLELENGLRHVVEREELRLYYQPIVDLSTGRVVDMEALLRWEHPEHGLMAPDEFIPVAEETGMIVEIGAWVLREACQTARAWQDRHAADAPTVCVNVSPRQFRRPELAEEVSQALDEAGLEPASLTIELTESALMEGAELTAEVLGELKALGVTVAIDDFGKGYSSLGRLERLPVDLLKIERSFIGKLQGGPTETAIVEAVAGLGHGLGMKVVAEGIETAEQMNQARRLGCDMGQGYYFSRPVPPEEAGSLLARRLLTLTGELADALR